MQASASARERQALKGSWMPVPNHACRAHVVWWCGGGRRGIAPPHTRTSTAHGQTEEVADDAPRVDHVAALPLVELNPDLRDARQHCPLGRLEAVVHALAT